MWGHCHPGARHTPNFFIRSTLPQPPGNSQGGSSLASSGLRTYTPQTQQQQQQKHAPSLSGLGVLDLKPVSFEAAEMEMSAAVGNLRPWFAVHCHELPMSVAKLLQSCTKASPKVPPLFCALRHPAPAAAPVAPTRHLAGQTQAKTTIDPKNQLLVSTLLPTVQGDTPCSDLLLC